MLTALSTSALAAAAHPGMWHAAFFPFLFLIPIFWIVVIVLVIVFVARGRRHAWARGGYGPWGAGGPGAWGHGGGWGARSAESTLAQRFANGDIDEKEYRARLEVLRASGPTPPQA
ncbi:hypothetical protein GCM10009840_20100 [Pseudolysinimonas kribbensis]|uniref:SHOCT domain-containing protein n=1 Tax=Pseudolysinimonas kribbensis TaxID=433641 RepID=A0ABQ6K1V7_9MICO|nr:hypothetical protein [Pseudolysinimonas kribbensis]GMA93573.1 hypothetical protein GCM10025881_03970 [Pseudolysinimonas kribbensis]